MEGSVVVLPTADGKGAGDVEDAPATGTPVHGVGGGSVLDVYASTGVDGTITPCTTASVSVAVLSPGLEPTFSTLGKQILGSLRGGALGLPER